MFVSLVNFKGFYCSELKDVKEHYNLSYIIFIQGELYRALLLSQKLLHIRNKLFKKYLKIQQCPLPYK